VLNPGGDERIELKGKTALVPHTILGGAGAAEIDITGIPATYDHLRLVAGLRTGVGAAALTSLQIRINADAAAANYASLTMNLQHSAALSTFEYLEGVITGGRLALVAPWDSAPAGYMGVITADFYECTDGASAHLPLDGADARRQPQRRNPAGRGMADVEKHGEPDHGDQDRQRDRHQLRRRFGLCIIWSEMT
jgi:hypothetical protein